MKSSLKFHTQSKLSEEDTFATTHDFQRLFAREMTNLFRLSLQLTADAEKAESCLILAMKECIANSTVSGMENAVLNDVDSEAEPGFYLQPSKHRIEALRNSLAILSLPDFDRLVFVICVLERYSILDCALLLTRSPKDVNEARLRASNQVASFEERNHHESTTTSPYGAWSNEIGGLDDSCGALFD
jgi:hypothetical protein